MKAQKKFQGTAEQYVFSRLSTKIFFALLFGWAYCVPGCSRAIDNTVVKETKVDETSKTDATSTSEGGTTTERAEGPVTVTETAGWYEVVAAPGTHSDADELHRPALPYVQPTTQQPQPVQIAPGVFQIYHPPVKVTLTGPVDEKQQTWEKTATDVKKDINKDANTKLRTEDKSSWAFLNHWYYWLAAIAAIAAIARAGYVFRKSIPILKWIP